MAGDGGPPFFGEINNEAQVNHNLGRVRDELRDLGTALMFFGTSTILHALTTNNRHVLRGLVTFLSGLGLVGMSFLVNRFPLAAVMLLQLVKNFTFGNLVLF